MPKFLSSSSSQFANLVPPRNPYQFPSTASLTTRPSPHPQSQPFEVQQPETGAPSTRPTIRQIGGAASLPSKHTVTPSPSLKDKEVATRIFYNLEFLANNYLPGLLVNKTFSTNTSDFEQELTKGVTHVLTENLESNFSFVFDTITPVEYMSFERTGKHTPSICQRCHIPIEIRH